MERKSIVSSNVSEVGYDRMTKVMEVKFVRGGVYRYKGVDFNTYDGLMCAESPGQYFREYILGKFPTEKLG